MLQIISRPHRSEIRNYESGAPQSVQVLLLSNGDVLVHRGNCSFGVSSAIESRFIQRERSRRLATSRSRCICREGWNDENRRWNGHALVYPRKNWACHHTGCVQTHIER